MLGPVENCVAKSSVSSSVQSSSAKEDFCGTGVVGAVEVAGVEVAAGSERTTVESVGGEDVMGVVSGLVGRTADGRSTSGCEGDSNVRD